MFFVRKRKEKQIAQDIYKDLLTLTLQEESGYEELSTFHKYLTDIVFKYQNDLIFLTYLPNRKKYELDDRLEYLVRIYANTIKLGNERIVECLQNDKISQDTKIELINFGRKSIDTINVVLDIMEKIGKCLEGQEN